MDLTHFDEAGRAHMVDVSEKAETAREAVATGLVRMRSETLARIREGGMAKGDVLAVAQVAGVMAAKGDVLAVAQVAGVMAAKQTPQIIPMCHTILLTGVDIAFDVREGDGEGLVAIRASVRTVGKTGAEMEALTAVSAAALTIYDMCKAIDRGMELTDIRLERKSGGKSGDFTREERK